MMYRVTFRRDLPGTRCTLSVEGLSAQNGQRFQEKIVFETNALLVQAVLRAGLPVQIALQDLWGPLEVQAEQLRFLGFGELP